MKTTIHNFLEPSIARGIKSVGVGKKGSRDLTPELAREILSDLQSNHISDLARGAFFGGLFFKGISSTEKLLEEAFVAETLTNPQKLVEKICYDAPDLVQAICLRLLQGETLPFFDAKALGDFLFSNEPGEGARGMAASVLRVRYETPQEYAGLLASMEATVAGAFLQPVPSGPPILQLAEPFNGIDHSSMITPLLAHSLQSQGFRVVSLVGRNGGPKFIFNALDIAQELKGNFLQSAEDFMGTPDFGWFLNQEDLSPRIDQWVERRREIIKRPFLATLEKFLNPLKADILITSAFHPPYAEKMITIAEQAGFPGAVVVRNGMEGTIAFALKRSAKINCTARQKNGEYLRHEFEFDPENFLGVTVAVEEKMDKPDLKDNVRCIAQTLASGKSGQTHFDLRYRATLGGLTQAVQWIQEHS